MECPDCGSNKTRKMGFILSRKGKKQRYQCLKCARTWVKKDG